MTTEYPLDPQPIEFRFPCLRARQPIGDIFFATIPFKKLLSITYFDVRRVLQEDRDFERYLGIQRPLDQKRVETLRKFVNFADASFPTSVIVAVEEDYVRYSADRHTMTISNCREGEEQPSIPLARIGRVIDGQHRIAGLEGFEGSDFDMSVTLFVGADVADQAHIFATVNLEQTKVNKSLVYDLYELARSRSPQKTCHNIAVALDRDEQSPLYKRIKRLGVATEGRVFEPITQATFVEGLIGYISKDPRQDRDDLLRGRRLQRVNDDTARNVPLRNLFVEEEDVQIAQIVYNYFGAVAERWPAAWGTREPGFVLNRTNGVKALLRFFRTAYLRVANPGDVPSRAAFRDRVFRSIYLEDGEFNTENFVPGTSGEARLTNIFRGREENSDLVNLPIP